MLSNACGIDSQHFSAFVEAEKGGSFTTNLSILKSLKAVFLAAKEDYEGGYLNSLKNLIHAAVFDDELEQASELLKNGFTSAAAVVAGVVLETTLRNLCTEKAITHGSLDRMNADLAKAGTYNSLIQKRITAIASIRNSAAHGKPSEFSANDVKGMIADVERFIVSVLS